MLVTLVDMVEMDSIGPRVVIGGAGYGHTDAAPAANQPQPDTGAGAGPGSLLSNPADTSAWMAQANMVAHHTASTGRRVTSRATYGRASLAPERIEGV